ncbi:hypothetical protein LZ30DRAFT_114902 [Colletotrichum cereale]|nr:hypothetical protein LZ30DRAFT_114902 [Colletotrichum cereale]
MGPLAHRKAPRLGASAMIGRARDTLVASQWTEMPPQPTAPILPVDWDAESYRVMVIQQPTFSQETMNLRPGRAPLPFPPKTRRATDRPWRLLTCIPRTAIHRSPRCLPRWVKGWGR